MSDPYITIRFDENGRVYRPGESLSGEFRVWAVELGEVKAVEVSILWYTDGKGEEDLAVHQFDRYGRDEQLGSDPRRPRRFTTTLPSSPLSYNGLLVKVRWCVRVRAFLTRGREVMGEREFRLGDIPAPRVLVS